MPLTDSNNMKPLQTVRPLTMRVWAKAQKPPLPNISVVDTFVHVYHVQSCVFCLCQQAASGSLTERAIRRRQEERFCALVSSLVAAEMDLKIGVAKQLEFGGFHW